MKTITPKARKSRAKIKLASKDQPDPDISQAEAIERSRKLIINAAPSITEGVIGQAKQGSYLHARMLFDFAGLTAAQAPETASISPVLELLMQELEKPLPKPLVS